MAKASPEKVHSPMDGKLWRVGGCSGASAATKLGEEGGGGNSVVEDIKQAGVKETIKAGEDYSTIWLFEAAVRECWTSGKVVGFLLAGEVDNFVPSNIDPWIDVSNGFQSRFFFSHMQYYSLSFSTAEERNFIGSKLHRYDKGINPSILVDAILTCSRSGTELKPMYFR